MPAALAFENVLDQKILEVDTWTGVAPRSASSAVTMPDPALRAALWIGAFANPLGVHVFAGVAAQAPRARPGPASPFRSDSPRVVEPLEAHPASFHGRAPRPARPGVLVRVTNLQQRLALAEFADAGLPGDVRELPLDRLRDAYRSLARAHHPDRHLDASEAARACHSARFARITAAYAILTDQPAAAA